MSTRNITDVLANAATEAAAEHMPAVAVIALRKTAAETDDPVAAAIVGIFADFVEENGRDAIESLGRDLGAVIGGEQPATILNEHLSAAQLTELVNVLQDAEAKQRRKYHKLAVGIAGFIQMLGRIVVNEAARGLMQGIR